ncbi:hypothetical protein PTTG_25390 [Puccinia triticina 1-1 BBBD Race 1]|uniref:CCHC-type domain-containing protein n=1 Tax=Puccinia triticina (isolate 1-1 / race 1 (BBBD)) TaxID=630390 RepID=A0A180H4I9_PUCT1|nr:hypothetical protein PTTG_25390 [Puccinia triticina 1-1 BBBD Race 1]
MPVQQSPPRQAAATPGSLGDADGQSLHDEPLLDDQHVDYRRCRPMTPVQQPPARDRHHRRQPAPQARREEDDLSLIADQHAVNGLVKSAIEEFGESNFLKPDGSNYMLCVGRRIIFGVIDPSMKSELQELGTAWDMLEAIKARFSGVTKAKMLGVLQQLRNVEVNMSTNPARVATEMKTLLDELNAMGTAFHYDDLLPLVIHENVAPGTALRFEFDRRIDAEISLNNHQPITFEKTWKTLLAAIHQVESSQSLRSNKPQVQFNSTSAPMERSPSVISHEDNVYVMAANSQTSRNKCYRCKSFGHLLADCPLNNPATHRYPVHSQAPVPYPRPQQPPMQAFYPIIAPAGSSPCYYPQRQPAQNPNLIPLPRPRDTY